jgi:hypothetical protein
MGYNSAPQDADKGFAGNIAFFSHVFAVKIIIRIPALEKE